ncbi:hypothetical protein, partial [Blastomonas sp. CCH1-A6]|uniref:hypothetical protein n=1 Tax=Blastomonas sp. CCH1-A6 TaxID=1768762 RepID=UPI001E4DE7E8
GQPCRGDCQARTRAASIEVERNRAVIADFNISEHLLMGFARLSGRTLVRLAETERLVCNEKR